MAYDSPFAAPISVAAHTGPGSSFIGTKRTPMATQPGRGTYPQRWPDLPWVGTSPLKPGTWRWARFIPPLALFNDASQWVNDLYLPRPQTINGNPDSLPLLQAQYSYGPPPINTDNLGAGKLNIQLQLGNIAIQAAKVTADASDYFGG